MSKPIHLYQLDIHLTTEQQVLSLTQRHLKLAVEHAHRQTTPHRRDEIRQEIEVIRAKRDSLIVNLSQQQELQVAL